MHHETLQERVQQKTNNQPAITSNKKKSTVWKHNNKKNKTCEKCDPDVKLELSYIQNTQQRKVCPHQQSEKKREYTYFLA